MKCKYCDNNSEHINGYFYNDGGSSMEEEDEPFICMDCVANAFDRYIGENKRTICNNMKKLLAEHIKRYDIHSARESRKGEVWKWNTPIMNEFIAFGKFCYYVGEINRLKHKGNIQLMVLHKNDIKEDELDPASLLDVCYWILDLLKDESFFPKNSTHIQLKNACQRFVNTHYQYAKRGLNG